MQHTASVSALSAALGCAPNANAACGAAGNATVEIVGVVFCALSAGSVAGLSAHFMLSVPRPRPRAWLGVLALPSRAALPRLRARRRQRAALWWRPERIRALGWQ
jgi:hypothetical protein